MGRISTEWVEDAFMTDDGNLRVSKLAFTMFGSLLTAATVGWVQVVNGTVAAVEDLLGGPGEWAEAFMWALAYGVRDILAAGWDATLGFIHIFGPVQSAIGMALVLFAMFVSSSAFDRLREEVGL